MLPAKLVIGTVQFGLPYGIANRAGIVPFQEAQSIIERARATGVRHLDTAIAYGDSEDVLGRIGVKDFNITTKLPPVPAGQKNTKTWLLNHVESSISRMRIDSIDALLLHNPSDLHADAGADILGAIDNLKKSGVVKKFGISVYNISELEQILGRYSVDVVQAPVNVFDRSLIKSGWIAKLKKSGIEVQLRSIFLQGLLLMDIPDLRRRFSEWNSQWDKWEKWLSLNNVPPLQACLNYVNSLDDQVKIVVGVQTVRQLADIQDALLASNDIFPGDEMAIADEKLTDPRQWTSSANGR